MKRLLAISFLAAGVLPSIPLSNALAGIPNQEELISHCRDRLGFGPTEPVFGPQLLQLRRCIDNTRSQYEHAERLQRRAGITHYSERYDQAQSTAPTKRITRRTLHTQVEQQEDVRTQYYHNVSLQDRDRALEEHRQRKRAEAQEQQLNLLREIRAKQAQWKRAIKACVFYPRENRQECVFIEINEQ